MSTTSKIIALGTALAIGTGAFAGTASAAPFGSLSAPVEVTTAVDTVKWIKNPPKKPWHPPHHKPHHKHKHHYGEAALLGFGAFALGAAIAGSQAQAGPAYGNCYKQDVKIWSPQYQAYVIKTQTVCD